MIPFVVLERTVLIAVFLCALVPIAARSEVLGVPLYGIPLSGLYLSWAWRALHEGCLHPRRLAMVLPFVITALLLGVSTVLSERQNLPDYTIWAAGLFLLIYANQNWNRTFDFRFLAQLGIGILSIELAVSLAQILTKSYVGNAVMYFGEGGGVAEDVGIIAGGRVFRPVGTFGLPNLLSIAIVILSSILVPVILGAAGFSRLVRFYCAALVALGFFVLIYSTSRGNIIAMGALPVLFLLLYMLRASRFPGFLKQAWPYLLVCGLGASILAIFLLVGVGDLSSPRFLEGLMFRLEGVEESARFRFMQYWEALSALSQFPIAGMGFGQSALVWELVDLEFPGKEEFSFPPHNAYIVVALEGGLLAGVVYAGALLWLAMIYPYRVLVHHRNESFHGDLRMDGVYLAFLMFALCSLIYIVPLTRSLWPLGCFLIGIMQAHIASVEVDTDNG